MSRRSGGAPREATSTIVFSHGKGFPASTYKVLFGAWRASGWRVEAIEAFGHDPLYPVTGNWPRLRDQLVDFVRSQGEPCMLVGHSLGGYLSLMAACHAPQSAAGVVMMDSPLVAGWRAHGLHVAKRTGLIERISPGRVSRQRRHQWPSREAAREHLARKAAFATWDPAVLDDYVRAGLTDAGNHVELRFRREIETIIYNTLPHQMTQQLRRHPPQAPVAFIGGTQSAEVRQVGLAATRAVTRGRISWIEGSHLFPMQHPLQAAREVLRWINSFGATHPQRV